MKKIVGTVLIVMLVLGVSGLALARMGGPGMGFGPGGGGPCWSGAPGEQGAQPGQGPGFGPRGRMMGRGNWGPGGMPANATQVDEAKAKEIANEYVAKHLANYKVEKFTQFQRPRGTMYQVELKGPQDELTYLHITPWGGVRAFPARAF